MQVGLKECPFVVLDAVANFEHGRVVRLIDRSSFLQGFDIVGAVLALIDETCMKIEGQDVVVFWRVSKETKQIEVLVREFGFFAGTGSLKDSPVLPSAIDLPSDGPLARGGGSSGEGSRKSI